MERELILRVKDLDVKFNLRGRQLHAIRGVSLDLYKGESLAIVGESGSGKSVTVYSIMQILASAGRIVSGSIKFGANISLSGLAVGALVGIIVNAILPGKDYVFSSGYSNGKKRK